MNGTVQAYRKASSLSRGNGWSGPTGFTHDIQRGEVKSVHHRSGSHLQATTVSKPSTPSHRRHPPTSRAQGAGLQSPRPYPWSRTRTDSSRGRCQPRGCKQQLKLSYLQPSSNSTLWCSTSPTPTTTTITRCRPRPPTTPFLPTPLELHAGFHQTAQFSQSYLSAGCPTTPPPDGRRPQTKPHLISPDASGCFRPRLSRPVPSPAR